MGIRAIRRVIAAVGLLWAFTTQAQVAAPASYAIMSLIGDKLTMVFERESVGSNLNRNGRDVVAMPDDTFDGAAVFAVNDAVKRLQPQATTRLFAARAPELFALQDRIIDTPDAAAQLAQPLKPLVEQARVTHLILVTKHRSDTRIRFLSEQGGSGKLSGLGFFVDTAQPIIDRSNGSRAFGYFAPYAYLKLTLFDAITLRPLREAAATSSTIVSAAGSKTTDVAWEAMTAAQKVQVLKDVIRLAVDEAMPKLVQEQ